jgi:hypothetical protein
MLQANCYGQTVTDKMLQTNKLLGNEEQRKAWCYGSRLVDIDEKRIAAQQT